MISHVNSIPHTTAWTRAAASSAAPAEHQPQDSVQLGASRTESLLAATADRAASLAAKLPEHVQGEAIVKLKGGLTASAAKDFASEFGAKVLYRFDVPHEIYQSTLDGELVQLKLPAGMTTAQAMAAMADDGRVEYVQPNHVFHLQSSGGPSEAPATRVPNDLDDRLWGLRNTGQNGGTAGADIHAAEAWAQITGQRDGGPLIAVIDTGADYNHPDLRNNIWTNPGEVAGNQADDDGNGVVDDVHGYNALTNSGDPMDGHSHGSHTSGTIGAEGDNGQGVVGVNWQTRVMPVKIFSDGGSTDTASIVRGILYATRMGARLTSNSWGGGPFDQAIFDAYKGSPALHIFAAGNNGSNNDSRPFYPSNYDLPNIVSVAATDRNDRLASFSNYGATTVDLAAPGVDILSTVPGGGYGNMSGTSMATPHVAGVAGLIAAAYPDATNEQIKSRLMAGADPVPQLAGKVVTGGRVNAANALENDTVAPGAPNDFRPFEASANGITLSWTASGDDGWCGNASSYDLRVADRPIVDGNATQDQVAFAEASPVTATAPSAAGTIERASVSVVPSSSERQLYFALKVRDNVGNASELRTTSGTIPAAQLAFEDTMEGDEANWQPDGAWARVELPGHGKVWTDSPDGEYGDNANTALTTRPISLAGFSGSTLIFDAKHELENRFDQIHLEASQDGQNWTELQSFTGSQDWSTRTADLSAFDGKDVQLRFRLTSDGSVGGDGFYLDNMVIAGSRQS
ncbi:MAG: S8 family serine peptidase [Armatimonadetes bacterium]|nr:S8 family serine peptidase [Armatimonadota bacterium]